MLPFCVHLHQTSHHFQMQLAMVRFHLASYRFLMEHYYPLLYRHCDFHYFLQEHQMSLNFYLHLHSLVVLPYRNPQLCLSFLLHVQLQVKRKQMLEYYIRQDETILTFLFFDISLFSFFYLLSIILRCHSLTPGSTQLHITSGSQLN